MYTIKYNLLLMFVVPCSVELRDNSEGGVGNIADELIKQGLVSATEEVHVQHKLIYITTCLSFAFLSLFQRQSLIHQGY